MSFITYGAYRINAKQVTYMRWSSDSETLTIEFVGQRSLSLNANYELGLRKLRELEEAIIEAAK